MVKYPIPLITVDGNAGEKARRVKAFDLLAKPFYLDSLLGIEQRQLGIIPEPASP